MRVKGDYSRCPVINHGESTRLDFLSKNALKSQKIFYTAKHKSHKPLEKMLVVKMKRQP